MTGQVKSQAYESILRYSLSDKVGYTKLVMGVVTLSL